MKKVPAHLVVGILAVIALIFYGVSIVMAVSVPTTFTTLTFALVGSFVTVAGYAAGSNASATTTKTSPGSGGTTTSSITGS
jgi:hypothetical protein